MRRFIFLCGTCFTERRRKSITAGWSMPNLPCFYSPPFFPPMFFWRALTVQILREIKAALYITRCEIRRLLLLFVLRGVGSCFTALFHFPKIAFGDCRCPGLHATLIHANTTTQCLSSSHYDNTVTINVIAFVGTNFPKEYYEPLEGAHTQKQSCLSRPIPPLHYFSPSCLLRVVFLFVCLFFFF